MNHATLWYDPPGRSGKRAHLRHAFPDIGGGPWTSDPTWDDYAFGYRRAVEVMLASANAQEDLDILVYPIVWLSRHAVEVALKGLVVACREELDTPQWFKKIHQLTPLWAMVEKLLRELHPTEDFAELKRRIDCLSEFDPDGIRFRYPEDAGRNGDERTSTTTEMAINIDVVAALVMEVLNSLAVHRERVANEGEDRRADAYHAAEEEWLLGLSDEDRDAYIAEQANHLERWSRY